jgi:hypothetical protein
MAKSLALCMANLKLAEVGCPAYLCVVMLHQEEFRIHYYGRAV